MSKIAKKGSDAAWKGHVKATKEEVNAKSRVYRKANSEKVREWKRKEYLRIKDTPEYREKKRKWYLAHRDEILRQKKEKNALKPPRVLRTKEEIYAKKKAWNLANREKRNADARKWRQVNLSKQQKYAREYHLSKLSAEVQYTRLLAGAELRKRPRIVSHNVRSTGKEKYEVQLTLTDFIELIKKPCQYCGETEERRGVDRVDNSLGYTKENSAPCCKMCNYMKKNYSVEKLLSHVKKIYLHNS